MESKCCGYCTARYKSINPRAKYCSRTCQVKARSAALKNYKSKKRVHLIQTDKYFYCMGYNIRKSNSTTKVEEATCKDCIGRYRMSLSCTVYEKEAAV